MNAKRFLLTALLGVLLAAPSLAEAPRSPARQDDAAVPKATTDQKALFKKFEQAMNGSKLVGQFTILGRQQGELPKEEYAIRSVKKLPRGDLWLITANIKYGNKDLTVPMPLEVKWAGDTPVITLTDFKIPGLGTFSARVVIYNNKYAGTWTHGEVGGHLFGTIEKTAGEDAGGGTP